MYLTLVQSVCKSHFFLLHSEKADAERDVVVVAAVGSGGECKCFLEVRLNRILRTLPEQQERLLSVNIASWLH